MKYLKRFNDEFKIITESVSESTIKDILLDLTDYGFKYKISWSGNIIPGKMNRKGTLTSFASYPLLKITISRETEYFYNDVIETIDRLSGYLESEGYYKLGKIYTNSKMFNTTIDYKFSSLKLLKAKSKFSV